MTTDPAALQERVTEELYYQQHPEGRHRSEWPAAVYPDTVHEYRDLAAAVLPIITTEVRDAKADAWAVGYGAGQSDARHHARGPSRTTNPYKEDPR